MCHGYHGQDFLQNKVACTITATIQIFNTVLSFSLFSHFNFVNNKPAKICLTIQGNKKIFVVDIETDVDVLFLDMSNLIMIAFYS